MSDIKKKAIEEIKKIFDPEIPVNIYELGLIYKLEVDDKNHFKGLKEKPSYKYIVNIGVYVCSKKVFEYININKPMNMTDLISKLNNSKHNVVIYEIDDHQWIDTGQISEFKKALKDIDKI